MSSSGSTCREWKKAALPFVYEDKGAGTFRLNLKFTRGKGHKAVKKVSKQKFAIREDALAAAPGWRLSWELGGRGWGGQKNKAVGLLDEGVVVVGCDQCLPDL
eukprot:jgi/Undpi1/10899/HiC_scaffold_3.g01425.m1